MSLYSDLGLDKGAIDEDIKRAYRKKARETHPDKGGSSEKFQIVSNAYAILSDAERRQRYDETGEGGYVDEKSVVYQQLGVMLFGVIENTPDLDHTDLIAKMKQIISEGKKKADKETAATKKKIEAYQRTMKRFKNRNNKKNRLADMIKHNVGVLEMKLGEIAKMRKLGDDMEAVVEEYVYEADTVSPAVDEMTRAFFHNQPPWPGAGQY